MLTGIIVRRACPGVRSWQRDEGQPVMAARVLGSGRGGGCGEQSGGYAGRATVTGRIRLPATAPLAGHTVGR